MNSFIVVNLEFCENHLRKVDGAWKGLLYCEDFTIKRMSGFKEMDIKM